MSIENILHIWRQKNFTLHFPLVELRFAKLYIYDCCLVAKLCPTLLQPYGQEPNRLLSPWDFPGKNTGVGCHFLVHTHQLLMGNTKLLFLDTPNCIIKPHIHAKKNYYKKKRWWLILREKRMLRENFRGWLAKFYILIWLVIESCLPYNKAPRCTFGFFVCGFLYMYFILK